MNIENNNSSVKNHSYLYFPCPVRIINFESFGRDEMSKIPENCVFCEYCENTTTYDY